MREGGMPPLRALERDGAPSPSRVVERLGRRRVRAGKGVVLARASYRDRVLGGYALSSSVSCRAHVLNARVLVLLTGSPAATRSLLLPVSCRVQVIGAHVLDLVAGGHARSLPPSRWTATPASLMAGHSSSSMSVHILIVSVSATRGYSCQGNRDGEETSASARDSLVVVV
uniref:Uncharacterized protein n=1 Tax=Zea mays TaxID=4577 RepID=A0A804LFP8_MAIZE